MAIVREVAHLHGGDAEVRSEPGKGSTFAFELKRGLEATATPDIAVKREAPPKMTVPITPPTASGEAASDSWRSGPFEGAPLALVVEDDPDLRNFTAGVLSQHYRVRTAADGAHGLELALRS